MNRNLKVKLIICVILMSLISNAQDKFNSTMVYAIQNISRHYGNILLDTTYLRLDTSSWSNQVSIELEKERKLIRDFQMKLIDFSFKDLFSLHSKVRSLKEFYNEESIHRLESFEDSMSSNKIDAVLTQGLTFDSSGNVIDVNRNLISLIQNSTFFERLSREAQKGTPKFLTVIGVFEGETFYLIVYRIMMLYGTPHYVYKSEVVLK
jgi:hypothetical protein